VRSRQRRPLRRLAGLAAMALLAGGIGVAQGDDTIVITQEPVLQGTAQVGESLAATGAAWFPGGAKPHWQWLRCDAARSCEPIDGATDSAYVARGADRGDRLRAALVVTSGRKDPATAVTGVSEVVAPKPDPPKSDPPKSDPPKSDPPKSDPPKSDPPKSDPPKSDPPKSDPPTSDPPTSEPPKSDPPKSDPPKSHPPKSDPPKSDPPAGPAPPAPPAPPGTGFDTTAPVAAPAPTGAVKGTSKRNVPPLRPFPTVRVQGVLTSGGARIARLVVRAPKRARVTVLCRGSGCRTHHWAGHGRTLRVKRMQGVLPRGTRLVVLVTRRGYIGKRTEILVRRGRPPLRSDRCVAGAKVVACPR
jgi:hypothetical protein